MQFARRRERVHRLPRSFATIGNDLTVQRQSFYLCLLLGRVIIDYAVKHIRSENEEAAVYPAAIAFRCLYNIGDPIAFERKRPGGRTVVAAASRSCAA